MGKLSDWHDGRKGILFTVANCERGRKRFRRNKQRLRRQEILGCPVIKENCIPRPPVLLLSPPSLRLLFPSLIDFCRELQIL